MVGNRLQNNIQHNSHHSTDTSQNSMHYVDGEAIIAFDASVYVNDTLQNLSAAHSVALDILRHGKIVRVVNDREDACWVT